MSPESRIEVDLQGFEGVCFLIGYKTGVCYSHQCGGLACHECSLEGFLVPCSHSLAISSQLYAHFYTGPKYKGNCYDGIDLEDAALIDRLLASVGLGNVSVDRDALSKSKEAWVYLKVNDDTPCFPFCYNSNPASEIVMIWENSD